VNYNLSAGYDINPVCHNSFFWLLKGQSSEKNLVKTFLLSMLVLVAEKFPQQEKYTKFLDIYSKKLILQKT
jgi:hypothetical protein